MNIQVKSAGRVLDVLELFSQELEPLGVSEVSRRLALPKSSAHGLLTTLAMRGYLLNDGGEYRLAPEVQGPWTVDSLARLTTIARPVMQRIAAATGESAFLGVMTPDLRVRYVAKVVSRNEVRYDASLDHLRLAHCTSIGLAILGSGEVATIDRYLREVSLVAATPRSITDHETLRRVLVRARKDGFAEIRDGNVEGASGVSAPIFQNGAVKAALNLGAPSSRFAAARLAMRKAVIEGAAEVTRGLAQGTTPSPAARAA
jgi:DNA-binding IclR family transcriptional regulator